ncbi:MAG: phospholipase A [Arachidicoccus sp.]|nr:phospholipase A [Arachidicoccus sp.]
MQKILIATLVFFTIQFSVYGQITDTTVLSNAQKDFLRLPSFSIYKDNYFISGTAINQKPDKYNSDIKYQISFRQVLYRNPLFLKSFPYLSYTQKAFWDIFKSSKPFAEINFNPAIGFLRPYSNKYGMNYITASLEHESNGRDSIYSRSWNRFVFGWHTYIKENLQFSLEAWIPFGYKEDNPDLLHYEGFGQLGLSYVIKEDKWFADVLIRKGDQWNWKGYIQGQISYKLFRRNNEYLMLQWYNGYAESLINYQKRNNMLRVGLLLRPNKNVFF